MADPKYDMAVYPMVVAVRSASNGADVHQVHLPYCDCADFTNRKGRQAATADGAPAVTICKHLAEALERVGGWHREAPAAPAYLLYPVVTRGQAVTVLTSHYIGSTLVDRLLKAAVASEGLWATAEISAGLLSASYDNGSRRYSLRVPAAQPLNVAAGAVAFPVSQRA